MIPGPPSATYRVQFHAGFTFRDACLLVPYLHDLGVSLLYASPYLRARSGSTHGYDVADPSNFRWRDVLENGPASVYAPFFDINWEPLQAPIQDHQRIVVPTLGEQYGKVLESVEQGVRYDA